MPKTNRPILVLPGVMASRLYFPSVKMYWDPDSKRRMIWWAPLWPVRSDDDNRRDLHVNQPAGVVVTPLDGQVTQTETDRGWGGVAWSYYRLLLRSLQSTYADRQVHAIGYDWRQPIEWIGWYAAQRIRKILTDTGAADFSVVTHSMGGLVLRAALKVDQAMGLVPSLDTLLHKVIHICQPSVGAVILYRRLFTGLVWGYDGGLGDAPFRMVLGNTRTAFLGNMSGLPGPMELLPSPFFPGPWNNLMPVGTPHASGIVPPAIGAKGLAPNVAADLATRVAGVNGFHAWLGPPPANPALAAKSWLLYGSETDTETAISFTPGNKAVPTTAKAGDGVVPLVSATALGLPPGQMVGFKGKLIHAYACTSTNVLTAVQKIGV